MTNTEFPAPSQVPVNVRLGAAATPKLLASFFVGVTDGVAVLVGVIISVAI